MKLIITCPLLTLFAFIETTKPKTVNLNLKTVFEFQNKDNSADIQIIDNIQTFLDTVKGVIQKKRTARRNIDNDGYKFTDFIENIINTLKNFEDEDLEDVVAVLDDEIRKYHYRGCKFHELIENRELRRFVALKLERVRDVPAKSIKRNLDAVLNVLERRNFDKTVNEVIDYVNSMYRQDSEGKFKRFHNNLELYRSKSKRANLDLIKVIREGIRSIIFDHYTNLNVNARRDLKLKLETFWHNYLSPVKDDHKAWNFQYTKYIKNLDLHDNTKKDYEIKSGKFEAEVDNNSKHVAKNETRNRISTSKQYNDNENSKDLGKDKMRQNKLSQDKRIPKENIIVDTNKFIPVYWNDFPQTTKSKSPKSPKEGGAYNFIAKKFASDTENDGQKYITNKHLAQEKKHEAKKKYRFDIKKHPESSKQISRDKAKNLSNHSYDDSIKDSRLMNEDHSDKVIDSNDEENDKFDEQKIHTKENIPYKIKRYSSSTVKDTPANQKRIKHKHLIVTLYPEDITTRTRRKTSTTRSYRLQTLWNEEVKQKQYAAKERKRKKTTSYGIMRTEYPFSEEDFGIENNIKKPKHGQLQRTNKKQKMHKVKSSKTKQFEEATEKSRKTFQLRTKLTSDEGLSIESFEADNIKKSLRKSINDDILGHNGTTLREPDATTTISTPETKSNTVKDEAVTEDANNKLNEVDYGPLDFWEGTTKNITIQTTTKTTSAVTALNSITKPLNSTIQIDAKENITAETQPVEVSTPVLILRSSNDVEPKVISLKNQAEAVEGALNLTEPLTDEMQDIRNVTQESSPTETTTKANIKTTTAKKITTSKATVKSKTVKGGKKTTKIKSSKLTSKYVPKIVTEEQKSSTNPEKADMINVIHFLNQSETLNTEDERKKKMMHEKFMRDMAAIFAPTTKATVTYVIPKEATDPFQEIEDELNFN